MKSTLAFLLLLAGILPYSCKKNGGEPNLPATLDYGDSIFYLRSSSYTIQPLHKGPGTYTAYPGNLKIDASTGAIDISLKGNDGNSQTGLRYKIKYVGASNETDSTYIVIAGINYLDRFYKLSQNDSIIYPVYNADLSRSIPSGNYDIAHDNKFAINPANGQININECIRRGFFNDTQLNASWKQTTIRYTTGDNSGVTNSMDVILYYYNTLNDVPGNVSQLMQAHQRMALGVNGAFIPTTPGAIDNNLSSDLSLFKPRPPCVVIIGH